MLKQANLTLTLPAPPLDLDSGLAQILDVIVRIDRIHRGRLGNIPFVDPAKEHILETQSAQRCRRNARHALGRIGIRI
ncbi:MAG: hypothetical protein HZB26_12730 [Candidatus Hydrogenedentes bacterium]|nr:hypothetical protein [Candidatus Hydrogenedentota bacterium]